MVQIHKFLTEIKLIWEFEDIFTKVLYKLTKGDYLITCAGEDISRNRNVTKSLNTIELHTEALMVDFSGNIINENREFVWEIDLNYQIRVNTLHQYLNLEKIDLFTHGRIVRKEILNSFEILMLKLRKNN